jgi:hypothetical protein
VVGLAHHLQPDGKEVTTHSLGSSPILICIRDNAPADLSGPHSASPSDAHHHCVGYRYLLTVAVILSWAAATARSNNPANALAASGSSINPLELMKSTKDLLHQQYDAF